MFVTSDIQLIRKFVLIRYSLIVYCLLSTAYCFAATIPPPEENDSTKIWSLGGVTSVNFTQMYLKNWSAGGQPSLSATAFINLYANFKRNKTSWDNSFDIAYGLLKSGKTQFVKTDDKIDLTSKFGLQAFSTKSDSSSWGSRWYYSSLINFKTQMDKGFNYPDDSTQISGFLAPAYILIALGMDYKPNDAFTLMISPLTGKFTIVRDQNLANIGAFGVEPGKNIRNEFGIYVKLIYKRNLMENITFQTKVDLFSNYIDHPENIDINWEVLIIMKVNKYISANISASLIYDDDIDIVQENGKIGPATQFKELFGVGLSYKF